MRKPLANARDSDGHGGLTDKVTPHAGVALVIESGRRSGVIAAAERALAAKTSPKGLRQGELVETVVLRSAVGGDGLDDLDDLRRDQGVAALTGDPRPAGWRHAPCQGERSPSPATRGPQPPPPARGGTASMTRRRGPTGRCRAASSRRRRRRGPGCGPQSRTACVPMGRPCGRSVRSRSLWMPTSSGAASGKRCRRPPANAATSPCG